MSAGGDGEGAQVRRVGRNFLKMSDRSVRRSRGGEVTRSIQGVIKFHAIDSLGVRGGAASASGKIFPRARRSFAKSRVLSMPRNALQIAVR